MKVGVEMAKITGYEEFVADHLKDEVTDMHNPECKLCNDCCSMGTMILAEEYEQLKKFLKTKKGKKIYKESSAKIKKYLDQGIIYYLCPFSTKNRRCAIYDIRPKACREFHCSPKLNKLEKREISEAEHYTIYHLFNKQGGRKRG